MKINYEEIRKNVFNFKSDKELLEIIKRLIEELYYDNKNYKQKQWINIQDLKDIFDNIEIEETESEINYNEIVEDFKNGNISFKELISYIGVDLLDADKEDIKNM